MTRLVVVPRRVVLLLWLAISLVPAAALEAGSPSGLVEAIRAGTVGLQELFVVVPVAEGKVLAVGRDAAGAVSIRSFDHDSNKVQTLLTEDSFFSKLVRTPWYVEAGLTQLPSRPDHWLGVVLYQAEDPASGSVYYETHMRLLLLDGTGLVWTAEPEKIAETSISYWEEDPSGTWHRARRGSGVGEDGVGQPAIKELVRVFARDANGDGVPDVVLWKKNCRSVRAADAGRQHPECGADLEPAGQEMLIAPYQADGSMGALRPGEVASLRNARAWAAGLGRNLPQER